MVARYNQNRYRAFEIGLTLLPNIEKKPKFEWKLRESCKLQNHSFVTNKYIFRAMYIYLETTVKDELSLKRFIVMLDVIKNLQLKSSFFVFYSLIYFTPGLLFDLPLCFSNISWVFSTFCWMFHWTCYLDPTEWFPKFVFTTQLL